MKRILFVLLFLLISFLAFSQNIWNQAGAGANDWSNINKWSLGYVPIAGEAVQINNATDTVTLDVSTASLGDLTIAAGASLTGTGFTINTQAGSTFTNNGTFVGHVDLNGTFTQNGVTSSTTLDGNINYITGNFTISGGTFVNNSVTYLRFDNANTTINQGAVPNLNSISIGASTKTLGSNLICTSLTFDNIGLAGILNTAGFDLTCSSLTYQTNGVLNGGAGTIQINGNATDSGTGTLTGGAGDITITGNLDINTVTESSGTTSVGGATVTLNTYNSTATGTLNLNGGAQAFTTNNQNLRNLTISSGAGTVTTTGQLNIAGDLNINNGDTLTTGANNLSVGVNATITGTLNASGQGAGNTISIAGDTTVNNGGTFTGGAGAVGITGTLTCTGTGNLTTGTGNPTIGNVTGTGIFNATTCGTVDVNGNLTVNTYTAPTGGALLTTVAGSFAAATAFTPNGGTVNFDGAGPGNTIAATTFNNMTISGGGTWDAGGNITVGAEYTQSAGILNIDGNTLDINTINAGTSLTGGRINITTGLLDLTNTGGDFNGTDVYITGNGDIDATGQTVAVHAGNIDLGLGGASLQCMDFDMDGGSFDAGNGTITDSGNFTVSAGTFTADTSTLRMTGVTKTITTTASLANLIIDDSISLMSNVTVGNNLTIQAAPGSLSTNGFNLTVNGTVGITLDCNGTLDASAGGNITCSCATVDFTGGTFTAGAGAFTFSGGINQNFNPDSNNFANVTVDKTANTVTLTGILGNVSSLTIVDGIFDIDGNNIGTITTFSNDSDTDGDGTFVLNGTEIIVSITNDTDSGRIRYKGAATITGGARMGNTFYDIEIAGAVTLGSNITVNQDLLISAGDLDGQNRTINLARNWSRTGGAFTYNTSTVNLNTATAGAAVANNESFYNLTVSNGTKDFTGGLTIDVFNDLTISGGTLNGTGDTFNVAHDWNHSAGAFTYAGSTVNITGAVASTSTISGDTTFNNLSCTVISKQINFTDGTTQIIDGTLTLTGATGVGNQILLRSTSSPTKWNIRRNGGQSISFVDIQDSEVVGVNDITATSSKNSGGNDDAAASPHWIFNPFGITWTGNGGINWATASSWDVGYVPNATDNITIPDVSAGSGNDPDLDAARTVRNLTINAGGYLTATTAGDNLTVSQTFNLDGTLDIGNNTLTVITTFNNTGLLRRTSAATTPIDNNSGATRFYGASGTVPAGNYNILTIDEAGSTFTLGGAVVTNDANDADLTIGANTTLNLGGNNLSVGGNLSAASAGATLTATGTENITVDLNWDVTTFNQSSSEVIFTGNGTVHAETFYDLTVSGGARDITGTLTIQNDLSITGGTLNATGDTINIAGDWLNTGGAFTQAGSTVNFNGTAGTQQIDTNAENFNIVNVTDEDTRIIELLDTLITDGNFTFESGIFYFNGFDLEVFGNITINGGTFRESGVALIAQNRTITAHNRFDLNCTNNNIVMDGALAYWYLDMTGSPFFGTTTDSSGLYTITVSNSQVDDASHWVGGANIIIGGGTITNCIRWTDTIDPYITMIRTRINHNIMHVEFSENVYDEGSLPPPLDIPVRNNFVVTGGPVIDADPLGVTGSGNTFNIQFLANLSIADILNSTIAGNSALLQQVMDAAGNYLASGNNYPLGCSLTESPQYSTFNPHRVGIDFFTNLELTSTVNSEDGWGGPVNNFTGSQDIYYNGLVLTADMDSGISGTAKVYYVFDDSQSGNQFYIPAVTSGVKSAIGRNVGGNKWAFNLPVNESDGNKYIKIVLSANVGGNEWYCYRSIYPTSSTQFYECATYAVKLKRIALQNNNTTILNNVINPRHGDTAKLLYTLEKEGPVSIVVYDLKSDLVKVLKGSNETKGTHSVTWDGKNENGKIVTRGVYFIRIRAPGIFNQIRKVLVIK